MKKLIETLKNIYKIEDLRNRLGMTLFFILIYRLGSFVVLPGLDPAKLGALKEQTQDGLLGLARYVFGWSFLQCIGICFGYYAIYLSFDCDSVTNYRRTLFPTDAKGRRIGT
jgi:preprotein translocase subunit SecY